MGFGRRGGVLLREAVVRKRGPPDVRYVRPAWNAKRSTCVECGGVEEQPSRLIARLNVCTSCIKVTVERYRTTRYWAVYESGELVCVTVYKKGALSVKRRLEAARSARSEANAAVVARRPTKVTLST